MTELLPIPYLAPPEEATYRELPSGVRQRLIAAARAVVEDDLGYRRAAVKHQVGEIIDLLRAIVQPIKSREQAPPWEASVCEPTSQQQLLPPVNALPTIDVLVERKVSGVDVLREYIEEGRLTPLQATAVMLLSLGEPAYLVADKLGVEKTTIYAWRRLPDFQEAHGLVIRDRVEALVAELDEAQSLALAVLREQLQATKPDGDGKMVPDNAARIKAAESLLDRGGRLLKSNRLELTAAPTREVASLEAQLALIAEQEAAVDAAMAQARAEAAEPLQVLEGGRGS